jgi:YceI-like domain
VRGFFREFEGTLDLDAGRAYGTVKAASLDTNVDMRDEHPRSSDFFEVAEHPELRFESTEIRLLDEDTFEIEATSRSAGSQTRSSYGLSSGAPRPTRGTTSGSRSRSRASSTAPIGA